MKVADLMRTDLKVVEPDATIEDAVIILADGHVSALPVVDPRGRLIGVLSTTDVLQAEADCESAGERDRLFENTTIREIMTSRPITVLPDSDVREAALQMLYLDIHRVFVEDKGKLVGVLSQSDVVRAVAMAKL
jgi:acetoin utilization protein AcuB